MDEKFLNKLEDGSLTVGIIGLGYVGLPLALTLVSQKVKVLGFDLDKKKIDKLNAGQTYRRRCH